MVRDALTGTTDDPICLLSSDAEGTAGGVSDTDDDDRVPLAALAKVCRRHLRNLQPGSDDADADPTVPTPAKRPRGRPRRQPDLTAEVTGPPTNAVAPPAKKRGRPPKTTAEQPKKQKQLKLLQLSLTVGQTNGDVSNDVFQRLKEFIDVEVHIYMDDT